MPTKKEYKKLGFLKKPSPTRIISVDKEVLEWLVGVTKTRIPLEARFLKVEENGVHTIHFEIRETAQPTTQENTNV